MRDCLSTCFTETSLELSTPDTKSKQRSMDVVKDNLKILEMCFKVLYEATENRSGVEKYSL